MEAAAQQEQGPHSLPSPAASLHRSSASARTTNQHLNHHPTGASSPANGHPHPTNSTSLEPTSQKSQRSSHDRPHSHNPAPAATDPTQPAQFNRQTKTLQHWLLSTLETEQHTGVSFSHSLHSNTSFRNPAILHNLLALCNIDEFATHIPNRNPLAKHEYYDELHDLQEELAHHHQTH